MKKIVLSLIVIILCSCGSQREKSLNENIINTFDSYGFPFDDILRKIKFKQSSDELLNNYKKEFDSIVSIINDFNSKGNFTYKINAHTDSVGSKETNLILTQKRASKIKKMLTVLGVNPNQLKVMGYGELQPIDTNQTKKGRERNRRIEIIIVPN